MKSISGYTLGAVVALVMAVVIGLFAYAIWFEVNDPGHGQITGKTWRPAYYYSSCSTANNVTTCTQHYNPDCYEVRYTDGKHDGDACVAPEEYEQYEVGGYYPRGAG